MRGGRSPGFVHLRVRSVYSLLEGALPISMLADLALSDKQPALAICDNGNLFGALEFCTKLSEIGIQPIIGMMLSVDMDEGRASTLHAHKWRKNLPSIALFAQNEEGYRQLMSLSSESFLASGDAARPYVPFAALQDRSSGLIALTGGPDGPVNGAVCGGNEQKAREYLRRLHGLYGNRLYIELQRHGLQEEILCEPVLLDMAYETGIPLVASNDVFFPEKGGLEAQKALFCIAEGRLLSEDIAHLSSEHYFKCRHQMVELFSDLPEVTENTVEIAKRCSFWLRPSKPVLPRFFTNEAKEREELVVKAREGLSLRLSKHGLAPGFDEESYGERLKFELDVIGSMHYSGYFLIVADFIGWARGCSIPVGPGRGSGAGSLVAWAVGITELDPLRFGLLFERFLNPERVSMPDFDVDFCQERRDEVIDYVCRRYGDETVAHIITFGTLQARAVLRDVGRILEMPYGEVDALCKLVPHNPANPVTLSQALKEEPRLRDARAHKPLVNRLMRIALRLEGLYRHASTHAAGIVIGNRALKEIVPLYRDQRASMPVTQFNMKWIEQAGLVKFDFLGLKTLTIIEKTILLLKKRGVSLDIEDISLSDTKTYALLSSGETTGVFQVESAGMRDALKRMAPDRLEDIIALVALHRPGPMDNIQVYCDRKHGREEVDCLYPKVEPVLRETYGVIIYQEQVMQIAQLLSGYSLGQADLLRRAMGKKIKKEMDAQRRLFIDGAVANGIGREQAERIFELIAKFADYGFNKSHAAAYALISYRTAYLKAHYPVEFLAASMTCDMNNANKISDFCREANRLGIHVAPPSLNSSGVDFSPAENGIHCALTAIKTVGRQVAEHLVSERNKRGPFKSISDFASRIDARIVKRRALESMASVGVFDEFDVERGHIFSNVENILAVASYWTSDREWGQERLFGTGAAVEILQCRSEPWCATERLRRELDLLGFFLSGHPLGEYMSLLQNRVIGVVSYQAFTEAVAKGATAGRLAAVVMQCQERRSKSGRRYASVICSDPTGQYEAIVFSDVFAEQRGLLKQGSCLILNVESDTPETEMRLRIQKMERLEDAIRRLPQVNLRIMLESSASLGEIAELLTSTGLQSGHVHLIVLANRVRRRVRISLPGLYTVDPRVIPRLKSLKGVVDVCVF